MVSAGVCFDGKERSHLIPNKTKVNAKLYVETLLPELLQDRISVLPSGFIFQQDGVPAHTAKLTQDCIATAVNLLVKMNGLRTRLTSTLWTTMSGSYAWTLKSFQPSRKTSMSSRKFCSWHGTSCHKTRSTKPHWASQKDFRLVWKLVMDISNIRYHELQHDHAPSWATQPCTPTVNARRAVQ